MSSYIIEKFSIFVLLVLALFFASFVADVLNETNNAFEAAASATSLSFISPTPE